MRRVLSSAVVLVGSLAAVAMPSPAVAHLGGEHFQVTTRAVSEHYEDVGRKGPSRGDTFTFAERLFQSGDRVGRDYGTCTVMRVAERSFTMQCAVNLLFRNRGQLTVDGAVVFKRGQNNDPELPITGGTGDYAGAAGVLVLIERRGEPTRLRIHLED